jgi:hypothetical protein
MHDPDTAVLPLLSGGAEDERFGRARFMLSARSVTTGVRASDLASDEALRDLVVATLAPQLSVSFPAAPYFRVRSLGDPWLEVDLRAASMAQAIMRGGPIAVFVQVDMPALLSGVLANLAGEYAKALKARGLVFLQIAGLDVERVGDDSLHAYLDAVSAWRAEGFTVIADRVGRFGVAAVGAGATGMTSGTRVYRTMPDVELEHQYRRSGKVRYWAPSRGDSLPSVEARKRSGRLPACPIADCDVLNEDVSGDELRWHNVHLVMEELLTVRRNVEMFAAHWATSPRNYVRAWGQALKQVIRRRKQA